MGGSQPLAASPSSWKLCGGVFPGASATGCTGGGGLMDSSASGARQMCLHGYTRGGLSVSMGAGLQVWALLCCPWASASGSGQSKKDCVTFVRCFGWEAVHIHLLPTLGKEIRAGGEH